MIDKQDYRNGTIAKGRRGIFYTPNNGVNAKIAADDVSALANEYPNVAVFFKGNKGKDILIGIGLKEQEKWNLAIKIEELKNPRPVKKPVDPSEHRDRLADSRDLGNQSSKHGRF